MQEQIEDVFLNTPNFSDENIIGYNVGIRPHRKSGVRIESEKLGNKLIIHNYGYGGSGLTLCWGGAQEVIQILNKEILKSPERTQLNTIAVLGAGVIGLSTAHELLKQGHHVNIYAKSFSPSLTSNIAAGIISAPYLLGSEPEDKLELLNRLLDVSVKRFMTSLDTPAPEFAGIKRIRDYRFESASSAHGMSSSKFKNIYLEHKKVRVHFDNGMIKMGKQIIELGLDGKLFMDDLYTQVTAKGASIHQKYFTTKNDITSLNEKIIINCTSMGSHELFDDSEFIPVKGHIIYIKPQSGIDYSFYANITNEPDYWIKLYPWKDRLILGGVHEKGKKDQIADQHVLDKLIFFARDFFFS